MTGLSRSRYVKAPRTDRVSGWSFQEQVNEQTLSELELVPENGHEQHDGRHDDTGPNHQRSLIFCST